MLHRRPGQHQQVLQIAQLGRRQLRGQGLLHQGHIAMGPGGGQPAWARHHGLVKTPVHPGKARLQGLAQPPGGRGRLAVQTPAGRHGHHAGAIAPQLGGSGQLPQGLHQRRQLLQLRIQITGGRQPPAGHQHPIGRRVLQSHRGRQRRPLPGGHGGGVHPGPHHLVQPALRALVGGAQQVGHGKQAGRHAAGVQQQSQADGSGMRCGRVWHELQMN